MVVAYGENPALLKASVDKLEALILSSESKWVDNAITPKEAMLKLNRHQYTGKPIILADFECKLKSRTFMN